ncbi:MAG: M3 family oligoendopeptidase [Anaerolineae bacterium]
MTRPLPQWDMTPIFPGLDSPEFDAGFQAVLQAIAGLAAEFDANAIDKRAPAEMDDQTVAAFDAATARLNAVTEQTRTLFAYLTAFVTTNSRDNLAQSRMSELQQHAVTLNKLGTRYTAWIGSLDVAALIERSAVARDHAFMLRKTRVAAAHLMSPSEESLAAELNVSAGTAWAKLHGTVTSQLTAALAVEGQPQTLPMSMIRNLASDTNRDTRRAAYDAELEAWPTVAVPLAAALNSIKGEVNTLVARRGWGTAHDQSLFQNNMDRATLDAMLGAAHESFPDFRRYMRAKARALGVAALPWYDLFAPMGASTRVWEYDEATDFIEEQFGAFSPRLRAFAARAFRESWIDAEPHDGKRDGAYCMWIRGDESRIFANYKTAYRGVATLAHELGHGYHNLNLARRTILQRDTPMTLAETASTFCETITYQAALKQASGQERLALVEGVLQDACQIVVDITSRYLFESAVFERRRQRELTIDELNAAMLDAQRQTYGDGLDPNVLHPYMWAVKGHYYSAGRSFYNYPYMFGQLFGLGLYARFLDEGPGFTDRYDDLLASTGMDDAATLAARFGIDIRSADFWRGSLNVLRADIDRFVAMVDAGAA